jgi:hypothetical protein
LKNWILKAECCIMCKKEMGLNGTSLLIFIKKK